MKKFSIIAGLISLLLSHGAFAYGGHAGLPGLPMAAGTLVGEVAHSYGGLAETVNCGAAGSNTSCNWSEGNGMIYAWAAFPNFNFETWSDTSSPYGVGGGGSSVLWNGADAGIAGDHLEATNNLQGCMARWAPMLATNAQIIVDDCAANTINSGDTGGPVYTSSGANLAYIESEIIKHIQLAIAAHKYVIEPEMTNVGWWPIGDARYTVLAGLNTFVNTLPAIYPNVKVWPRYAATSNGDATPNLQSYECDGQTTLTSSVAPSDTTIHIASGTTANAPTTGTFYILVQQPSGVYEQMLVTAGAGTTTYTVTRAQEGTSASSFNSGYLVCNAFIHPARIGGAALGATLSTVLQSMISTNQTYFNEDATVNNLSAFGAGSGTSSCGNAGTSGSTNGSWIPSFPTNRGSSTAVCSQTTIDASHNKANFVITPGGVSDLFDEFDVALPNITTSLPTAGQCVQAYANVTSGSTGPIAARLYLNVLHTSSTQQISQGMNAQSGDFTFAYGLNNYAGFYRSDIIKVFGDTVTSVRTKLQVYYPNSMTAHPAFSIDNFIVRNVTCPWTLWGISVPTP